MMEILGTAALVGLATYMVEPDDLAFGLIFELVVLAALVGLLVFLPN
jgi:hypothetical protein